MFNRELVTILTFSLKQSLEIQVKQIFSMIIEEILLLFSKV